MVKGGLGSAALTAEAPFKAHCRLYKLGLADREKRKAEAALAVATAATPVEALGLHRDLTAALIEVRDAKLRH